MAKNFPTGRTPPAPRKAEPIPEKELLAQIEALRVEEQALYTALARSGDGQTPMQRVRLVQIGQEREALWHLIRCQRAPQAHHAEPLTALLLPELSA